MNGVVNSVEVERLRALCQIRLTCGSAVFRFYTHFKVLLGGVGNDFAQQFGKLGSVLGFFPSRLFPIQTDFGIAFTMGNPRHSQVHTHFRALSVEVGPEVFHYIFGSALRNAYNVFGSPAHSFFLFNELFLGSLALGALCGSFVTFINIAAYAAYKFCHNINPPYI